ADFRLCCRLAFWGNRNAEFINRTFRSSALMRDKWDSPRGETTYGAITIANAIKATTDVYQPRDPRVVIDLTADFHLGVDAAISTMTAHEEVFRRANVLVRVVRHETGDSDCICKGLRRSAGTPLISEFTVPTARTMISRVARFRRWDVREGDWA